MLTIVFIGRGAVFALIETDVDPCLPPLIQTIDESLIMALSGLVIFISKFQRTHEICLSPCARMVYVSTAALQNEVLVLFIFKLPGVYPAPLSLILSAYILPSMDSVGDHSLRMLLLFFPGTSLANGRAR